MIATISKVESYFPKMDVYKFQLNHKNPHPSMYQVNSESDRRPTGYRMATVPNTKSIPLMDQVFDPVTRTQRVICVRSGELSIFLDEQNKDNKAAPEMFVFDAANGGIIQVEKTKTQLLDFLSLTDFCGNKPNRDASKKIYFWFVDENAIFAENLDKEEMADNAKNIALKGTFDQIMDIAMGIEPPIDLEGKSEKAIRWELLQRAKADPQGFINISSAPETRKKSVLRKAVEKGIIKITTSGIAWASGQQIIIVPKGQNKISYFVSLKTKEIEDTYQSIRDMLEMVSGEHKKERIEFNATPGEVNEDSLSQEKARIISDAGHGVVVGKITASEDIRELFMQGRAAKCFIQSPHAKNLYQWKGQKNDDYKSRKVWEQHLSTEPELKEMLVREIEK